MSGGHRFCTDRSEAETSNSFDANVREKVLKVRWTLVSTDRSEAEISNSFEYEPEVRKKKKNRHFVYPFSFS